MSTHLKTHITQQEMGVSVEHVEMTIADAMPRQRKRGCVLPRTSILLFGIFGQGKTLLTGQLASWIAKQGAYTTRMYSADGGGDAPVLDRMRLVWTATGKDVAGQPKWESREINSKGSLDVLHMGDAPFKFEFLDQVTKGWWPSPEGKMLPPTAADLTTIGARVFEGLTSFCA